MHNYDQQEALEELFNVSPDEEQDTKQIAQEEEQLAQKKRKKK